MDHFGAAGVRHVQADFPRLHTSWRSPAEDDMQSGRSKFGRFLFFIGVILLLIYFAIDQSTSPAYGYFCIGIVVFILGAVLMMRSQQPPAESMRFRTLRRWREQQKQRREERKKQPFEH